MQLKLKFFVLLLIISFQLKTYSQLTRLSNNTNLQEGAVVNGKALLVAKFANGNDSIWVSDGTAAGTIKLTNLVSYVDTGSIAFYKNKLFFTGRNSSKGAELWVTDGTSAGTILLKDIYAGTKSSMPRNFYMFNNILYFSASDSTHGTELWKTDGTTAGTVLVKDINPGKANGLTSQSRYSSSNGIMYITANDGSHGLELWKSDGTATGTVLVKDITTGAPSTSFSQFINLGTKLLFSTISNSGFDSQMNLWISNGTASGTTLIKNFGMFSGFFPSSFFSFKNKIYFIGTDYNNTGSELWVTDGTIAGTKIVKDINPGQPSSDPFLFNAIIINNKFYFTATTDANGAELWMSDGTSSGTVLFKEIYPGTTGSDPIILKNFNSPKGPGAMDTSLFNGKIFFMATDATHGQELWITNGTVAGTTMVKDIWPGKKGGMDSMTGYFYTTTGLYFSGVDSLRGVEPWFSNGTSSGTNIVADINPGKKGSDPSFLFTFNNHIFLNANNGDNMAGKTDLYKINVSVTPLSIVMVNKQPELKEQPEDPLLLTLFPNPVAAQLNVKYSGNGPKEVFMRVIDNNGKIIIQQKLNNGKSGNQNVDVSRLPKGMYYLQLMRENELKTEKFVKQ